VGLPPHDEDVCARNSYPGNLDADLEARKLRVLAERITAAFGKSPAIYKAGRWGFGPHTATILGTARVRGRPERLATIRLQRRRRTGLRRLFRAPVLVRRAGACSGCR
jgi:hypothetical protein